MEKDRREKGVSVRVVDPLNPGFAFLALRAAIELDDIMNNKAPQSSSAVEELAKSLRETTSFISGTPSFTSLADPVGANLLNLAFERVTPQRIDTVESLLQRANDVASSLQKATPKSGPSDLRDLRDFCLALSQVASSFQQEERERTRPNHPHRH